MKFLFLSIASCLLVSNVSYASEKKPLWNFPIITGFVGLFAKDTHNQTTTIKKNVSENWTTIDIETDTTTSNQHDTKHVSDLVETAPTTPVASHTKHSNSSNNLASIIEAIEKTPSSVTSSQTPVINPLNRKTPPIDWKEFNDELTAITAESQTKPDHSLNHAMKDRSTPPNTEPSNHTKSNKFMEINRDSCESATTDTTDDQSMLYRFCGCCFKKKSYKS